MTITETTNLARIIAVAKLEKSPLNARRTVRPDGIGELKASILAHGLMQNLVVTDAGDGNYRVIAGGRRLEAIHSLQTEGKLPTDFAVPCQVVTEEHALEKSLAENTVRLAMHPADQFDVFAELIEQGQSAAQIAERFGIEESLVLKRMKLARVAPELVQEYRNDRITLECLMAFTIVDDHKRQLKVFKSLQDWQKDDPSVIRAALTEKMIDAASKLARFVGLDAYLAEGGTSRADLFGDEVYLEKPAILHRLAGAKLDDIRKELEGEGWAWVAVNPERDWDFVNRCGRIQPRLVDAPADLLELKSKLDAEIEEIDAALMDTVSDASLDRQQAAQDQLDEVERQLAYHVGFDADHKALAGCFVSIGQDGAAFIDKGLVKPEHRRQLAHLLNANGNGEPVRIKPKDQLPATLRRDLAASRLQIAQAELAKHPAIAFDLMVFHAASRAFNKPPVGDGPNIQFGKPVPKLMGQKDSPVGNLALAAIAKALPVDWLKPGTEAARFEAFRALTDATKLELLACCVALTLQAKLGPAAGVDPTAYDLALSLTAADVAAYWRPAKDNFLGRVNREQLLTISRDVLGDTWAQARRNDKKSLLVEQLHKAFADPEMRGRSPEQTARLKSWLPAGMAFDIAVTPEPKTKKARKAA